MNSGKRNWNNFFLGLLVAFSPWLGLPVNFKNFILSIAGLLISLFALARLERQAPADHEVGPTGPALNHHPEHEEKATS